MPDSLLIHADGANGSTAFVDSSPLGNPLSVYGTTTISTANPKFGTGALDNGATPAAAGLSTANPVPFNFGAGQFTVEAFVYFTAAPSGVQAIMAQWPLAPSLGWTFRMNSGALAFFYSITGSDFPGVSGTFTPTLNTWYHVAADRDAANVLRVYVNGAVIASAAAAVTIFPSASACFVANELGNTRGFPGRMDEVRITKGLAQYGGAFTPPTGPFGGVTAPTTQARAMVLA